MTRKMKGAVGGAVAIGTFTAIATPALVVSAQNSKPSMRSMTQEQAEAIAKEAIASSLTKDEVYQKVVEKLKSQGYEVNSRKVEVLHSLNGRDALAIASFCHLLHRL